MEKSSEISGLQRLCSLAANRTGKSRKQEGNGSFIVYYRVSTKRQGESGLGLDAQREAAESYVRKQGGTIIAEYREVETGKDCRRTEIIKAILHADRSWATLVIAKLDRLARNLWFTSTLMESKIDFVACDNPHATRLTIHILAAVAEEEARLISQRTKAALTAYKARGGILGPATFKNRTEWQKKATVARQRGTVRNAELSRDAYHEVLPLVQGLRRDGLSLAAIASRLNDQDYKTRMGKAWNKSQVKRILDRVSFG